MRKRGKRRGDKKTKQNRVEHLVFSSREDEISELMSAAAEMEETM